MKAAEQYFPVVLFIMLCKVVLTFESVDHILSVTPEIRAIAVLWEWCLLLCRRWFQLLILWLKSLNLTIEVRAFKHNFPDYNILKSGANF